MVTLTDPLPHRLGRRDIERHGDFTERASASHHESPILEHAQHPPVTGHHLGIEAMNAARRRDRRELLEHPRRDATSLKIVRDGERDLGDPLFAQPIVAGHRHHTGTVAADQRKPVDT